MLSRVVRAVRWSIDSYVLFVVVGIVLGLAVAPFVIGFVGGPDGTVAVVPVDGTIDGQQATLYGEMMAEARSDADAVVIVANSGGGAASASEEMYMQTKRTTEEMPVVTTVDAAAASGAYYTVAPSDHIFVKPSSTIGSVGVFAEVPPPLEPIDLIAASGPDKLSPQEREFVHTIETLKNAFVGAVDEERGDRIELETHEISDATTYIGAEAVENGFADEIGDREAAIQLAAEEAGLERPEVEVLLPDDVAQTFAVQSTYLASDAQDRELESIEAFTGDTTAQGVPTYLMFPPGVVAADDATDRPIVGAGELEAIDGNDAVATDADESNPIGESGTTEIENETDDEPSDAPALGSGEAPSLEVISP